MNIILAVVLSLGVLTMRAQSQVGVQWQRGFGGNGVDQANVVKQTSDGGYIVGGSSQSDISGNKTNAGFGFEDFWVVKTDAAGNKRWDKSLGGSGIDVLSDLQQTDDGGYILGGYSVSDISGNKAATNFGAADFWVVKIDADGNKQWDKSFGGGGTDSLFSLQQTSDGGYILGGNSFSGVSGNKTNGGFGNSDFWVIKVDADGAKQWEASFGGSNSDDLFSLQQTTDGGYILGGKSISGISGNKTNDNFGSYDYWVVKIAANGIKQWEQVFGGTGGDVLNSLQQTSDGGYVLGGYSASVESGNKTSERYGATDYWLIKTDYDGNKQWEQVFGGTGGEQLFRLQQTGDGGFILGGYSTSGVSGNKTSINFTGADYWIVKVDSLGNKQLEQSFGGNSGDFLQDLQQTSDGGYVLAGYSNSDSSGNKTSGNFGGSDDFWLVKIGTPFCISHFARSLQATFLRRN